MDRQTPSADSNATIGRKQARVSSVVSLGKSLHSTTCTASADRVIDPLWNVPFSRPPASQMPHGLASAIQRVAISSGMILLFSLSNSGNAEFHLAPHFTAHPARVFNTSSVKLHLLGFLGGHNQSSGMELAALFINIPYDNDKIFFLDLVGERKLR